MIISLLWSVAYSGFFKGVLTLYAGHDAAPALKSSWGGGGGGGGGDSAPFFPLQFLSNFPDNG